MENKPILSQSHVSVDKLDDRRPRKGCLQSIKKRHVLAIYAFSGFFVAYTLRANLSVAIVDMAQHDFHKVSLPPVTTTATDETTGVSGLDLSNFTTTTSAPEISQVGYSKPLKLYQSRLIIRINRQKRVNLGVPFYKDIFWVHFFMDTFWPNFQQVSSRVFQFSRNYNNITGVILNSFTEHYIRRETILRRWNRSLRRAQSSNALVGIPRTLLPHRSSNNSRPCSSSISISVFII